MALAHKGAISFGLVHIPIALYRSTRDQDISFNQLCKESKQRVHYKKYCGNCDKELKSSDIVKGYQYEKDKYVVMSNEEIESIKSEKDKSIHILQFCDLDEVNDLYYEKNYYAIPDAGAEKAYELLRKTMDHEHSVAIAKTVLGTKETLLALCPKEDYIIIKTLFYENELVDLPKSFKHPTTSKSEQTMAAQLLKSMRKPFNAHAFHDTYQERLMQAIEAKIQGDQITSAKDSQSFDMIDLMDALKQSVALQKKPTRKKAAHHS